MIKTGRLSPMEILGGHGIKDISGLQKMLAKAEEIETRHIEDFKG
jgi:quinone-modifying oxidoreductase subunit QmoC